MVSSPYACGSPTGVAPEAVLEDLGLLSEDWLGVGTADGIAGILEATGVQGSWWPQEQEMWRS